MLLPCVVLVKELRTLITIHIYYSPSVSPVLALLVVRGSDGITGPESVGVFVSATTTKESSGN